jgi:hypothetical protein
MVGMAAVGLAVVIAAGFVFALNRGDEATVSGVQPVAGSTFSVIGGEANQVPAAARVPQSDVSLNIEKIRLGLGAGTAGSTFSVIGGQTNQVPAAARKPAGDPTLNIEKIKLELAGLIGGAGTFSVIGGEANQVPVAARVPASDVSLNIEKYKLELQNAVRSLDIAAQRYEEYAKMLARQHAAEQAKHQAMWDQRFDDMVERFQNQYDGESALTPLQGRF